MNAGDPPTPTPAALESAALALAVGWATLALAAAAGPMSPGAAPSGRWWIAVAGIRWWSRPLPAGTGGRIV